MAGLMIFSSALEAIRAGFTLENPFVPDSEGFGHAWIQTTHGKAIALVRIGG